MLIELDLLFTMGSVFFPICMLLLANMSFDLTGARLARDSKGADLSPQHFE